MRIPYGKAQFIELREQRYFYADKTAFIPVLEDADTGSYLLFLRPRRFGKSLLLSMLAAYYDWALAERFDELFGGLYIHQRPTPERGQHMVLQLDFSTVTPSGSEGELESSFVDAVRGSVRTFLLRYQDQVPSVRLHPRRGRARRGRVPGADAGAGAARSAGERSRGFVQRLPVQRRHRRAGVQPGQGAVLPDAAAQGAPAAGRSAGPERAHRLRQAAAADICAERRGRALAARAVGDDPDRRGDLVAADRQLRAEAAVRAGAPDVAAVLHGAADHRGRARGGAAAGGAEPGDAAHALGGADGHAARGERRAGRGRAAGGGGVAHGVPRRSGGVPGPDPGAGADRAVEPRSDAVRREAPEDGPAVVPVAEPDLPAAVREGGGAGVQRSLAGAGSSVPGRAVRVSDRAEALAHRRLGRGGGGAAGRGGGAAAALPAGRWAAAGAAGGSRAGVSRGRVPRRA